MEVIKPVMAIYNLAETAKTNDEQNTHFVQKVEALNELVYFLQEKEPDQLSDDVKEASEKLNNFLLSATELISKFKKEKIVVNVVKSADYKSEFENLNKRLTDSFVTLSAALHEQQEKKLAEQEKKLANQERRLIEQDRKLQQQERKLANQEAELHEQGRKLANQERKLDEQEDLLLSEESQLAYGNKAYYCVLQ